MTDKELRRLSRKGLLEVLIAQTKETEKYKAQAQSLSEELEEYKRSYSEIGSLAGEALKVNGVCEAAQKAADRYLEEISRLKEEAQKAADEAQSEKERIIAEAQAKAQKLLERYISEAAAGAREERECILEEAHDEAAKLISDTKNVLNKRIKDVNDYAARVKSRIEAYYKAHPEVRNHCEEQENSESESEDE